MFLEEALLVLGIKEGSSLEELKAAYRNKAKETHPDRNGDVKEFIRIKNAYVFLSKHGTTKKKPSLNIRGHPYDIEDLRRRGPSSYSVVYYHVKVDISI